MRRLSTLEKTYTKERAVEVCMETLRLLGFDMANDENIRLDLDDRPQKSPRACVIASDPPKVVHLITRAQGGLHDYQAFLHEAGHALHYAGCDPSLSYTFRRLSRDHALTEIYSYILESITRVPEWHVAHFGLSDEEAAANAERDAVPRDAAFPALRRELQCSSVSGRATPTWAGLPRDTPTGSRRRSGCGTARMTFLSDMDAGFYSADYLRAWIRSAQLRALPGAGVGDDWWRNAETGDPPACSLLRRDATVERGDRGPPRLRAARHLSARRPSLTRIGARLQWPRHAEAHSSSGLGHRPLTAAARVRIPYAPPQRSPCSAGAFFVPRASDAEVEEKQQKTDGWV